MFQSPVIGTDWWEPIYSIDNEDIVGQAKILIALGTEEQINFLKTDRGFNPKFVTASCSFRKQLQSRTFNETNQIQHSNNINKDNITHNERKVIAQTKSVFASDKNIQVPPTIKQDATTQVDPNKDHILSVHQEMDEKDPKSSKIAQELLGSLVKHLITQREQPTLVENSTNTETNQNENIRKEENLQRAQIETNVQLKKTSDLLDSLHKAIAVDEIQSTKNVNNKRGKHYYS